MKPQTIVARYLKSSRLGNKGQTLVEFVLLLAVISGISYMFVAFMNKSLGNYWEYTVNLIVNDQPGVKTAILE
jgi:hypothetical protein